VAYTVLSSSEVIEACKNTIARINENRRQDDEKTLATYLKEKHYKWFRRYYPTPAEAIEKLYRMEYGLNYPSHRGYGALEKAEKIMHLAKLADLVNLNEDDAGAIFKIYFYPR